MRLVGQNAVSWLTSGSRSRRTVWLGWLVDIHSVAGLLELLLILKVLLLEVLRARGLPLKILGLVAGSLTSWGDTSHGLITVSSSWVGSLLIILVVLVVLLISTVVLAICDDIGLWLVWWELGWSRLLGVPIGMLAGILD